MDRMQSTMGNTDGAVERVTDLAWKAWSEI